MPHVRRVEFPKSAKLWDHVQSGDFIDGYAVTSPLSPRDAADIAFQMPKWVGALMALRNRLVRPFGLKTDAIGAENTLFPTTHESERELIVGTDDSHLNFRISILQQDNTIHMATWVHRKNVLGRVYLAVVMPFHVLIVRSCMKRVGQLS